MPDMEWQPIADAPKDGSWVLLFSPKDVTPRSGRWEKVGEEWLYIKGIPTHWMPLPAPPVS